MLEMESERLDFADMASDGNRFVNFIRAMANNFTNRRWNWSEPEN